MKIVAILFLNDLLDLNETLNRCSTLPADVHEGIWLLSTILEGGIIQLLPSLKIGGAGNVPCKCNSSYIVSGILDFYEILHSTVVIHYL